MVFRGTHTRTRSLINSQLGTFWSPQCPPICPIGSTRGRSATRLRPQFGTFSTTTVWQNGVPQGCVLGPSCFWLLFQLTAGAGSLQGPYVSIWRFGTFLRGCCFNTVASGLTRGADTISHRWWLATWMWVIVQTTWPSIPRIQKEAVMDFRQLRSHTRSPHYSSHQIKWLAQLLDNSCTTQVDQGTNVAGELFKERQGSFGLYYCIVQSFQLAHPSGAVSRAMNI